MTTDHDAHLSAIVAGDAQAFGQWASACETELRLSLRTFAAAVDTEAVLQEGLLRVWQVAPRHEPDGRPNSLLRLAVRITRNLAIDETRRLKRASVSLDEDRFARDLDRLAEAPAAPDPLLRRLIAACRDKLPDKPSAALRARLESSGGLSDLDLAKDLGMTKNTFLQNFTRARKMIARCLSESGVELNQERA